MRPFFLLALSCIAFASCSSDNDDDKSILYVNDSTSGTVLTFNSAGGTETVRLRASDRWSVTKPAWVTVSPTSGEGSLDEISVSISVDASQSQIRNGAVVFVMGKSRVTVVVEQHIGYFLDERTGYGLYARALSSSGRYMAAEKTGAQGQEYYVWDLASSNTEPHKIETTSWTKFIKLAVSDDGRLYPGGITPDNRLQLSYREERTALDNGGYFDFKVPVILENGAVKDLNYPETDIYGASPRNGYGGVIPLDISDNGNVVAGVMYTSKGHEALCIWERNVWDNYRMYAVESKDVNFTTVIPIPDGLTRDGRYMLCTATGKSDGAPAIYDIERGKLDIFTDLKGSYPLRVMKGDTFFYRRDTGEVYVYEKGVSTEFSSWMSKTYSVKATPGNISITGFSSDLSVVAWSLHDNNMWRNFFITPAYGH